MNTGNNPSSSAIRTALLVLQHAVSGKADLRSKPVTQDTRTLAITLHRPPNKPAVVELVPWGKESRRSRGRTTVWVLSAGDGAVLSRLRQRDESYVDLRGAVHLVLPWLLVDREGLKPPRKPAPPATGNPFSDRNSLVVRLLLDDPDRPWGIRELATEAGVSPGTVSKVVRRLALEGLAEAPAGKQPVRITDAHRLLLRWTRAYDWQRNDARAFLAPIGDPQRFLRRLPDALGSVRWALTMQAGASLVAPHATWDRVHVYVSAADADELYDIAERAGWPPADDGRLVLMKPYYKHSVWHGLRTVDGLPVVSDTQLVLDLWHYPLRGIEQAEHILNTTFQGR
jgi:hypothetical protein